MTSPPPRPSAKRRLSFPLRVSDLRGAARLAIEGTQGVTRIVEGVHASVLRTIGLPVPPAPDKADGTTAGLTGFVYGSVRSITGWVGLGLDAALTQLQSRVNGDAAQSSPQRDAMLAALNGVMGDRLETSGNPLATTMGLRYMGQALDLQAQRNNPLLTGKIVLLIHGLCMNDLQWRTAHSTHDHGTRLASELGYTPLYLRYNTGRHVSDNGRDLAVLLQQLTTQWPQPVTHIAVVAHSMGGLVIRSACEQAAGAENADASWLSRLSRIAFLGTPHHGAPLERAGHWVDLLLGSTPWSAPLAKLGQLRSAGITDLRHGHLLEQDWAGRNRFAHAPDARQPVPLPAHIACYTVAATTASQRSALHDRLLGDGLVPLPSALGQHTDPAHQLDFPPEHQCVLHGVNHLQLLTHATVTQRLLAWFAAPAP